ncbi:MAG TPA: hypothetical protein VF538_05325 [Pyrinomonadaceae bacterium]|jgi:hypothetical protein
MAQSKASEFYVRLEGIKLPQEAEERIADKVRATVMRELAALDLRKSRAADDGGGKAPTKGGAGSISQLLSKKDWYGYILMKSLIGREAQFNGSAINAGKIIQTNSFIQG